MAKIEHYSFGRIVIDGREHTRDVIVLPDRVVGNWWRKNGHSLVLGDLEDVVDELPSRVVVGCGSQGRLQPDPALIKALARRGVVVEAHRTQDAVRRYLELDPADTAAALHLTC